MGGPPHRRMRRFCFALQSFGSGLPARPGRRVVDTAVASRLIATGAAALPVLAARSRCAAAASAAADAAAAT